VTAQDISEIDVDHSARQTKKKSQKWPTKRGIPERRIAITRARGKEGWCFLIIDSPRRQGISDVRMSAAL